MSAELGLSAFSACVGAGRTALGLIVKQARSVDIAVAAASCGYDVLYLDLQHSSLSVEGAGQMCVAALGQGITAWVRVGRNDDAAVLRLLNAGAMGIVFPDVRSAQEARAAVRLCRFPPLGERSSAARAPQLGYRPVPPAQARQWLDDHTAVIAMIESAQALRNVEAIAAEPGISMLHVGCGDLAADLGLGSDRDQAALFDALATVQAACIRAGCHFGVGGFSTTAGAALARVLALRPDFVTAGNEWNLMLSAMEARAQDLRSQLSHAGSPQRKTV